jgi:chondroitin AC lyase
MLHLVIVFACLGVQAPAGASRETLDMHRILERYRSFLLQGHTPENDLAEQYAAALSEDGSWPDIDYADKSRNNWRPSSHLGRLRAMALRLAMNDKGHAARQPLHDAAMRALDRWLAHRFTSANWWWNEIGGPRTMRDVVILLGDHLDADRRRGALEVIAQHRVGGTGANLVWTAELSLHHACLSGNPEQVAGAAALIWGEVVVGQPEGIQWDWSFFQHKARLQAFHYGRSYLDVVVQVAWQMRQTPWAMPSVKRDIISNYILEGLQWMCRGTYTSPGTVDRAISRQGRMQYADLRDPLRLWREVHPERRKELDALLARQDGTGQPLCGFRHFPDADFTAYHRPAASVLLKTISTRTLPTEIVNSENLKGVPYLHSGDHYILRDGQEYSGLPPVWNWKQLPGLTMPGVDTTQDRRDFVGGLGDGRSGLVAMDYARIGEKGSLQVRKMWAFHEDLAVCLLGGWEPSEAAGELTTAIEQCRLRGDVQVGLSGGAAKVLPKGSHRLRDLRWVLHNGIGYIPLGDDAVSIHLEEAAGSWEDINPRYKDALARESVLRILLEHGRQPQATGYVLVLGADCPLLEKLTASPTWKVLQNDAACQSVRFGPDAALAALHAPTEVPSLGLCVDKPCLVLVSGKDLWLCDPTQKGLTASVTRQGNTRKVKLPSAGRAISVK